MTPEEEQRHRDSVTEGIYICLQRILDIAGDHRVRAFLAMVEKELSESEEIRNR